MPHYSQCKSSAPSSAPSSVPSSRSTTSPPRQVGHPDRDGGRHLGDGCNLRHQRNAALTCPTCRLPDPTDWGSTVGMLPPTNANQRQPTPTNANQPVAGHCVWWTERAVSRSYCSGITSSARRGVLLPPANAIGMLPPTNTICGRKGTETALVEFLLFIAPDAVRRPRDSLVVLSLMSSCGDTATRRPEVPPLGVSIHCRAIDTAPDAPTQSQSCGGRDDATLMDGFRLTPPPTSRPRCRCAPAGLRAAAAGTTTTTPPPPLRRHRCPCGCRPPRTCTD